MILLCLSLFQLSHDASTPVVSMGIFNSSTINLVTYVEFSKALSSSTLTRLHGCCSFFNLVRMNQMMRTGDRFDAVGNTRSNIVFSQTIVSMEVNTWMEVTLYKSKYRSIISPGLNSPVSTVVPLGKFPFFSV